MKQVRMKIQELTSNIYSLANGQKAWNEVLQQYPAYESHTKEWLVILKEVKGNFNSIICQSSSSSGFSLVLRLLGRKLSATSASPDCRSSIILFGSLVKFIPRQSFFRKFVFVVVWALEIFILVWVVALRTFVVVFLWVNWELFIFLLLFLFFTFFILKSC